MPAAAPSSSGRRGSGRGAARRSGACRRERAARMVERRLRSGAADSRSRPGGRRQRRTYTGRRMKRIVILISGRGSNMEAIVKRCAAEGWPARVVARDQQPAGCGGSGLRRSATASRPRSSTTGDFATREAFDAALAACIDALSPDLVVLAGFMRILGDGLRAALRRPAAERPPVAAAGLSRAAHPPARAGGRLQGGRRDGALRDARTRPRADRRAGGGAGAGRGRRGRRWPSACWPPSTCIYPLAVRWFVAGRLALEARPRAPARRRVAPADRLADPMHPGRCWT